MSAGKQLANTAISLRPGNSGSNGSEGRTAARPSKKNASTGQPTLDLLDPKAALTGESHLQNMTDISSLAETRSELARLFQRTALCTVQNTCSMDRHLPPQLILPSYCSQEILSSILCECGRDDHGMERLLAQRSSLLTPRPRMCQYKECFKWVFLCLFVCLA